MTDNQINVTALTVVKDKQYGNIGYLLPGNKLQILLYSPADNRWFIENCNESFFREYYVLTGGVIHGVSK
jgi:hypothetical protein